MAPTTLSLPPLFPEPLFLLSNGAASTLSHPQAAAQQIGTLGFLPPPTRFGSGAGGGGGSALERLDPVAALLQWHGDMTSLSLPRRGSLPLLPLHRRGEDDASVEATAWLTPDLGGGNDSQG